MEGWQWRSLSGCCRRNRSSVRRITVRTPDWSIWIIRCAVGHYRKGFRHLDRSSSAATGNTKSVVPLNGEEPSKDDIFQHLDRILKSDLFAGAPKQRHLLRHLVEKQLQGATGELKEYSVGVEVFGRGSDFDPRLDPIVRVEVSRLRTRLQKYYERTGADDTVRIDVPRGAYIPFFKYLDVEKPAKCQLNDLASDQPRQIFLSVSEAAVSPAKIHPAWMRSTLWVIPAACVLAGLLSWILWKQPEARPPEFVRFNRVTGEQIPCISPTFSPDGRFLVYARKDKQHWTLDQRRLGTLQVTNLLPHSPNNDYQPAYSPVANRIAFRSDRNGGGIFLLNLQLSALTQLTNFGYYPAWSPDGSQIAFSTETFTDPAESEAIRPSSLYVVDVKTRAIRQVVSAEPTFDALQPSWSPDGKMIAYWGTAHGGRRNIWVIPASASKEQPAKPVRITNDTWTDWNPVWSRDGRYLYLSSDRGGSMNIWRFRIDERSGAVSGSPEPVTTPSSYSGWAVFAPDGRRLAYVRRLVSSKLYKVPFDLNQEVRIDQKVQLTAGERRVREPEMSPDGEWMVARIQDPQEDLVLLRPDGNGLHRLTDDSFSDRFPHWSPDGKQIVFISNRSGRFELWSIHPDGNGLRQLTTTGNVANAWAPDGMLLGFPDNGKAIALDPPGRPASSWGLPAGFVPCAWAPGGRAAVGRIQADGYGRSPLYIYTPETDDFWEIASAAAYPSTVWLRDGFHLLFSRNDGISVADLRKHTVRQLMPIPQGNMHWRFTISHDEHTLFFVLSDDQEDIWIGHEKN